MFSMFRKSAVAGTAVLEAPAPVVAPVRVSVEPRMSNDIRQEYIKKAKILGVFNGALKEEMLLAFLKENGISIYPYSKVEEYLDKMFGHPCKCPPGSNHYFECCTWGWHPLREVDDGKLTSTRTVANGRIERGTYQQAVPLPVLLTVEKIVAAVPDIHFYVSGRVVPRSEDPFLAVTAVGMNMLIIERWDEPSFRG